LLLLFVFQDAGLQRVKTLWIPGLFLLSRALILHTVFENRLKAGLEVFGCDPKVFTYSQPVRVPGAWRDGKLQRLVWLRE
jgi:hypothetical protein